MRKAAMQNKMAVTHPVGREKTGRFLVLGNEGDCRILAVGRMRPLWGAAKKTSATSQTNRVISPKKITTYKALRLSLAETNAMIGKGGL
jgi:hypothetical protein